jgi:hypothetical protein
MNPEAFLFLATLLFKSSDPPKPPLFGSRLEVTVKAEDERACNAFRDMLKKEFVKNGLQGGVTKCERLKPEPIQ